MENEIMENVEVMEEETMDVMVPETEDTGMSTAGAVLLGAGLTVAGYAAVKLAKKGIKYLKARRELKKVPDDEYVEVTDEDIESVTK